MSQAGILKVMSLPPGLVVETLEGNSGGPVSPDGANNINIIGDGVTVDVVGNPGTNTLTISATGGMSDSFPTDSGTATPAANILNVFGGLNINTAGSGNTVTINLDENITITSMSTATQTPIPNSMQIIANSILGAGVFADVGIDILAKGNGTNMILSTDSTIQVGPSDIQFATPHVNTNIDQNTFTVDTSAAGTSLGQITFTTSTTAGLNINAGDILFVPYLVGSGTSTISQGQLGFSIDTTNNTPTTLLTTTALVAGRLASWEGIIQGTSITTGTDSLFARVFASAAYYTGAGSAVLIGTPVIDINTTNILATVTATVIANVIVIQVTGITAETWNWAAIGSFYENII